MPDGQDPEGQVAAHNGFLKGQLTTFLIEELAKVESPGGRGGVGVCFFQKDFLGEDIEKSFSLGK